MFIYDLYENENTSNAKYQVIPDGSHSFLSIVYIHHYCKVNGKAVIKHTSFLHCSSGLYSNGVKFNLGCLIAYHPVLCDSSFLLFKLTMTFWWVVHYCEVFSGHNTLLYVLYTGCQVLPLQRITHMRGIIMVRMAYYFFLVRCCVLENGKWWMIKFFAGWIDTYILQACYPA